MLFNLALSFTGMYLVTFYAYMYTTSLGQAKVRGINKILLASLYVVVGVLLFVNDAKSDIYDITLLIAIVFTCIGDIVLLFKFNLGALFFTIGNLSLVAHDILLLESLDIHIDKYWWAVLVYIGIFGGYMLLERISTHFKIEKGDRLKAFGYLAMVTMHGSLGVTLYFVTNYEPAIMLGIGSFLFMLSDYVLCSYKYSYNKESSVHKLNTFLYFLGIILITWSFYVI